MLETTSKVEPKELQEGCKENKFLATDSRNQVESISDMDENIFCTSV
jgi:hypothetical protein